MSAEFRGTRYYVDLQRTSFRLRIAELHFHSISLNLTTPFPR
jgi:hypothetical protein